MPVSSKAPPVHKRHSGRVQNPFYFLFKKYIFYRFRIKSGMTLCHAELVSASLANASLFFVLNSVYAKNFFCFCLPTMRVSKPFFFRKMPGMRDMEQPR